ncbi:MAG: hypothetical protein ACYCX3_05245 [Thermoleophilia bacterium]
MKVKSTGLGKTQLTAHFDGFTAKEGGEPSAVLIITSTEPVHWHIECDLGGSDLRQFAGQVLRPSMIWHLVKLLARGGEARGFVMEKEGGRRSGKERVSRTAETQPSVTATSAAPATAATSAATENPSADTGAAISALTPADTPVATTSAPARNTARTAPAPLLATESAASDSADRDERERRRAERRRQREEAAQQYVTAG